MVEVLLKAIIQGLNHYIQSIGATPTDAMDDLVVFANMANIEADGGSDPQLNGKIVVSMVNISEEASMKNKPFQQKISGPTSQENPPVHLNLYLLFGAIESGSGGNTSLENSSYLKSIQRLIYVVEYFQGNRLFRTGDLVLPVSAGLEEPAADLEILFDLHTLSFEQLNDLWGSLGGKQVPFILYRVRLFPITMRKTQGIAVPISIVEGNFPHV